MKKFAMLLCVLMLAVSFAGCKNKPCSKVKPYSDTAAAAIGNALQCDNIDLMKADFIAEMEQRGWCKPDTLTGPISMVVCPIVVPLVVKTVLNSTNPAWGCKATMAEAGLTAMCSAIPF